MLHMILKRREVISNEILFEAGYPTRERWTRFDACNFESVVWYWVSVSN